jgi:hypothetical protein
MGVDPVEITIAWWMYRISGINHPASELWYHVCTRVQAAAGEMIFPTSSGGQSMIEVPFWPGKEAHMRTGRFLAAFVSILICLAIVGNVAAQDAPFKLYAVEPPEGRPGEQMELILYGEGFQRVNVVGVEIEGVEVRDIRVESNEKLLVSIFIPENTPAGPRGIAVIASLGQNEPFTAFLEGGFFVHESIIPTLPPAEPPPGEIPPEEPPFEPPLEEDDNGIPILLILLVVLGGLGIGGGVLLATAWVLRNVSLKQTWQSQAQSQDLPKDCHPSTYITRREGIEFKPGRWKVKRLNTALYDSRANQRAHPRAVPEDWVSRLNSTARIKLLHGDTGEVEASVAGLVRELGALIAAWQDVSDKGRYPSGSVYGRRFRRGEVRTLSLCWTAGYLAESARMEGETQGCRSHAGYV